MAGERRIDPRTARAIEEAEGVEVFERTPGVETLLAEHEEAQGTDVFAIPDAAVSPTLLRDGAPGEEILSGDSAGLEMNDEDGYEPALEEEYPEG